MNFMMSIALVTLAACAPYELPRLTANHPANPTAPSASMREASKTLAYAAADVPSPKPVAAPPAAREEGHDSHHAAESSQKTVIGEGKIVATVPSTGQIVVDHGEIKDFMTPMTMGYPVEPASLLDQVKPGDQVRFTIDVPKKTIVKIEKVK
jgi:Cu/Ag efflux protein CusF